MTGMQQDYWNDVAGPVWAAGYAQMDAVLAPYAEALRDAARLPAGSTGVDVGCGCGATLLMARAQSPDATLVGVDVSQPMLDVARQRMAAAGDARTRLILGDAARERFPEASVDRVLSRFGVMFFDDPVAAFANLRRWLKPQGRCVAVLWGEREENPWMTEAVGALARHLDLPRPDPDAPGPFALGSADKRQEIFERAGLALVEERVLTEPMTITGSVDDVLAFYSERGVVSVALAEAEPDRRQAAIAALREQVIARHHGAGVTLPAKAIRVTLAPTAAL